MFFARYLLYFIVLTLCSIVLGAGTALAQPPQLDSATMECVSCHEDSILVTEDARVCHNGECGHPIGVDYAALAARGRGLTPVEKLDAAMKLTDGRMGCLTCHVPYSQADHETLSEKRSEVPVIPDPMLTVDNTGSRLCLQCHNK